MRPTTAIAMVAYLVGSTMASEMTPTTRKLGTFVSCPPDQASCLWTGHNGEEVESHVLRKLLFDLHAVHPRDADAYQRNLEDHMAYIEDVQKYAAQVGHTFSYEMGVTTRHITESGKRSKLPQVLVEQEVRAAKSRQARRLAAAASGSTSTSTTTTSSSSSSTFDWCTTANPVGYSVCSAVKSQENCGSCWAFAATDAIETAVAIAANQTAAVALSPQQFLSCSTRETEQTFTYCWASGGVDGASWVSAEIKWSSTNDGCNGGMTHGAFMDAAQLGWGLVTELELPYDDSSSGDVDTTCDTTSTNDTAASITGWSQVVGTDCSVSSDANVLLKNALQNQPIAVAINSEDPFKDYSSGYYSCPNDGDLSSKDDVNHALLLVGYGTDATQGDYWILKNSYGSSWGESGFMKLLADSKVNCGLNIFPVIPTGASAGTATATVDGGGDKLFVGLSPNAWIGFAAATSIFTIVATAVGIMVSRKKMAALREQNSGAMYLSRTPNAH